MAVLTVTYKGSTIAELTSQASKTFYTSSKYCEDDIILNYDNTSYEENTFINRTFSTYTNDNVTTIGDYAFAYCPSLTAVSFPACTTIGSSAFYCCSRLTTASFPECTTIGRTAFQGVRLTTASFPECTTIDNYAFQRCSSLTAVSFPACTSIGGYAFTSCPSLTAVSFPVCTTISGYAFQSCRSLTTASFPACTSIGGRAFQYCSSLTTASFPACTTIGSSAFYYCVRLKSLYLTNSSIATLASPNAFTSTPIGGYSTTAGTFGSIYVPASLLARYKTATNWTRLSSRFVGI